MDGYEVCRRLKADPATRDIPVIFVTAHSDEAAETLGLAAGAVDFLSKPINPNIVRARVGTHLTLKAQADLLRQWVFVDGLTGDDCLRRIAAALRKGLRRPADMLARYGGEEFACLLPEADLAGAMTVSRSSRAGRELRAASGSPAPPRRAESSSRPRRA